MQAILNAPAPNRRDGLRDRAMLQLCFAGGLRVSELVGVRLADLTLQSPGSLVVHGKGRRERCLPLWKVTAAALRAWIAVQGDHHILSHADLEACISPRAQTHLRPHGAAGHKGPP